MRVDRCLKSGLFDRPKGQKTKDLLVDVWRLLNVVEKIGRSYFGIRGTQPNSSVSPAAKNYVRCYCGA